MLYNILAYNITNCACLTLLCRQFHNWLVMWVMVFKGLSMYLFIHDIIDMDLIGKY